MTQTTSPTESNNDTVLHTIRRSISSIFNRHSTPPPHPHHERERERGLDQSSLISYPSPSAHPHPFRTPHKAPTMRYQSNGSNDPNGSNALPDLSQALNAVHSTHPAASIIMAYKSALQSRDQIFPKRSAEYLDAPKPKRVALSTNLQRKRKITNKPRHKSVKRRKDPIKYKIQLVNTPLITAEDIKEERKSKPGFISASFDVSESESEEEENQNVNNIVEQPILKRRPITPSVTLENNQQNVKRVSFDLGKQSSKEENERKEAEKPAFSFNSSKANTEKPAFSFGGEKSASEKPAFSFGGEKKDTEKPTFSFGDKPSTDKSAENSAEKPADKPAFSFGGNKPTSDKPLFSFGDKPAENAAEKAADKPLFSFNTEKPAETADKPADKPLFSFGTDKPTDKPADNPAQKPLFSFGTDKSAEKPADEPADKPMFSFNTDKQADKPADKPLFSFNTDKPVDTPAEKPTEKPSFLFGSSKPEDKPTFLFGASKSEDKPAEPQPKPLSFGPTSDKPFQFSVNSNTKEDKPADSSSGSKPEFLFGKPSAPVPFTLGNSENKGTSTDPKPAFGQPADQPAGAKTSSLFGNSDDKKPQFLFGSDPKPLSLSKDAPAPGVPAPGSTAATTGTVPAPSTGFLFGAGTSAPTPFTFGAKPGDSAASTPAPSTATAPGATPAPGVAPGAAPTPGTPFGSATPSGFSFNAPSTGLFGSKSTSVPPTSTNPPVATTPAPGFGFPSAQPPAAQPLASAFSFNTPQPPSTGFGFGSPAPAVPGAPGAPGAPAPTSFGFAPQPPNNGLQMNPNQSRETTPGGSSIQNRKMAVARKRLNRR